MMLDPPRLRRARAEDAATAAPLLVQALDVLALELAGVECLEAAVPLFHELFRLPGNRYSHAHAWVLDGTAGVVGVLPAYPGRDEALLAGLEAPQRAGLMGVLACDPRPRYQEDPERVYGLAFAGKNVKFTVRDRVLTVLAVEE